MAALETEASFFGRACMGTSASGAAELPGQTAMARVTALLFDRLLLDAVPGSVGPAWLAQVIALPITTPSRRRIRLTLRGLLFVSGPARLRATLACESRRVSKQLQSRDGAIGADGSLPAQGRDLTLTMVLPRSSTPRDGLLMQVLLEAWSDGGNAQVVIDSLNAVAV